MIYSLANPSERGSCSGVGITQPNSPSDNSTSRWPAASSLRISPSITSAFGPATSMRTAVRSSSRAVCAARSSVTGTGRASGCQLWSASRPVKTSSARRPSCAWRRHHGHLRLLVRCEPGDRLLQASSSRHDRDQQSIATECDNRPQVGLWGGLRGRGGHQTADLSTRCASVTRKWRGRQPSLVIHASTSTSDKSGGVGCSPPSPPVVERGTLG